MPGYKRSSLVFRRVCDDENQFDNAVASNGEDFQPRLKLRRCRSTSKAETIVTEDEKVRRAQPDKP